MNKYNAEIKQNLPEEMKEDPDINTEWIKINSKWKFLCIVHGTSMFMEMKP